MKKSIATILTVLIVMAIFVFSASAETLTPEAIESLRDEYRNANVVLDIYCLGVYTGDGYQLTDAYQALNLDEADLDDPESVDALAQEALSLTLGEGSVAVPAKEAAELDVTIRDLPLGLYLLVPHGSDLSRKEYYKTITTEDGEEKQVTIAMTDTYEYRFSPVLLAMNYGNADARTEIKAERVDRYGRLRIRKTVSRYNSAHAATFVFKLEITDLAGTKTEEYAGLTLNGTGSGFTDVEHLPIGATVVVSEVYTGSDLILVSGPDPESVVIEPDEFTEIVIAEGDAAAGDGGAQEIPAPQAVVSFTNTFNEQNKQGFGFTNTFVFNGSSWDWYQNGVLMTQTEAGK